MKQIKMSYQKIWTDCEPTEENFWTNLKRCDEFNSLKDIIMIIGRYYDLEGNENKSPKDLELELRKRNLNFGLIATHISQDNEIEDALNQKKFALIKERYVRNRIKIDEYTDEHKTDYYVKYSCRPRKYVIEETLKFRKSIEENLEKLELAGSVISIGDKIQKISEMHEIFNQKENDLGELIGQGRKLIKFQKVNFEQVFKKHESDNPGARLVVVAVAPNGGPILGLVKDSALVCRIGVNIYYDNERQKVSKYIPLNL